MSDRPPKFFLIGQNIGAKPLQEHLLEIIKGVKIYLKLFGIPTSEPVDDDKPLFHDDVPIAKPAGVRLIFLPVQ